MGTVDDEIIICRCQELTKRDILNAIQDGAMTVDGVKKRTRCCMGLCQGKTCERLIEQIIAESTGIPKSELIPPTFRVPVRPVNISEFIDSED